MKLASVLANVRAKRDGTRRRVFKTVVPPASTAPERLRREMMAAGDKLLSALKLESKLARRNSGKVKDEVLFGQWRLCRDSVDQLAKDYAAAVGAYRMAVEEALLWRNEKPA